MAKTAGRSDVHPSGTSPIVIPRQPSSKSVELESRPSPITGQPLLRRQSSLTSDQSQGLSRKPSFNSPEPIRKTSLNLNRHQQQPTTSASGIIATSLTSSSPVNPSPLNSTVKSASTTNLPSPNVRYLALRDMPSSPPGVFRIPLTESPSESSSSERITEPHRLVINTHQRTNTEPTGISLDPTFVQNPFIDLHSNDVGSPLSTHSNRSAKELANHRSSMPLHVLHAQHASSSSPALSLSHKTTAANAIGESSGVFSATHAASPKKRSSWDIVDLLALDSFRNWMVCFCVVNFDLEMGQAMEFMYPTTIELAEEEKRNICFSAFPDSNAFDVGDMVYNFRIRCSSAALVASGPTSEAGFLYGYVFFRQKRDSRIRRGYFQKSLVLVSQHPYVGLFSRLVQILGPAFFDVGRTMLEEACHNIASWKPPAPGKFLDLPFLGKLLQVEISQPNKPQLLETSPFPMETYRPDTQILASLPPVTMFTNFRCVVKDLWLCWELMVLAEPIVLMAPDPKTCSESVLELMDLINPISYCGDYRPYFTIHDTDFKTFVTKAKPPSSIIIGVTNPFFTKALQHWPNIIRVGRPRISKTSCESSWRTLSHSSSLDFVQGITSKRKTVTMKDKAILKTLIEAMARGYPPDYILNNTLRRYFVDMTEKFLVPLNRYFMTLIPAHLSLSSSSEPPHVKPFKTDNFLKSLQEHGPQLRFKSKALSTTSQSETYMNFYTKFLKCGNFATWLMLRTDQAQAELRKRYLQVLCDHDIRQWMCGKEEVEVVDLLVRILEELRLSQQQSSSGSDSSASQRSRSNAKGRVTLTLEQREKLKAQADVLVSALPKDLRDSLAGKVQ